MAELVLEGGCLCGAVRYRTEGRPFDQTNCHCVPCRRSAGAPYLSWATFRTEDFELARGEPTWYRSSPLAERGFCGRCGTQLTFRMLATPEELDLTVASMDDPNHPALSPQDHLWVQSRLEAVLLGDLPAYPQRRGNPSE